MWCKNCHHETFNETCEFCDNTTESEIPLEICWCRACNIPVIKRANDVDYDVCPLCGCAISFLSADLRPVFPEERLLFEIMQNKPLAYVEQSVWASDNRYYVNGKPIAIPSDFYKSLSPNVIWAQLSKYKMNDYTGFNEIIKQFIKANNTRLRSIIDEAHCFIQDTASTYSKENIIISFSGGKDSTVVADLVVRALADPNIVHIFGNTTLEFPMTLSYVDRFRAEHMKTIFKIAENKEQDFYSVCNDIGPPARNLRWCCSMFKTGPITRTLNRLYGDKSVLTFNGIRKYESFSRSRYKRVDDNAEVVKIKKQKAASPIFSWKDLDVWLYMLAEGIDFNDAYRLGYDRVGCWCCPNNNVRAQFLSKIYMPEESMKWRSFLVNFAKRIGKIDAEEYVDSGGWKARQGGNGVTAARDIKIHYTNCTTEDNAKLYQLNKPIDSSFIELFIPFGRIAPELGRKIINEVIVVDVKTNMPILSIQPFSQVNYDYAVKIKTMNVAKHEELQRIVSYQIKKYNACRKCLLCESLCKHRAISIVGGTYHISAKYCTHCRMCVTAKYLDGGCLMVKYLKTRTSIKV